MKRQNRFLASVTALLLAAASIFVAAVPAAAADTAQYGIQKSAVEPGPFAPGDTITYQIVVNCSSTNEGGCDDTVLSDTLPEPLMFNPDIDPAVTVELNAPAGQPVGEYDRTIDTDGNSFTVTPATDLNATPKTWAGGNSMTVTVNAIVKPDADGTWDGQTVTNTAGVDGSNAPPASSPADITLDVETTLVPSIEKVVSPTGTLPAVPGQPIDWTVTPGNGSNQNVDTIVVQDPVSPPGTFGGYLDVTGYDVTPPAGTTGTTTEYWVDGDWTATEPDPISDAQGIRVTFTGSFAPGATGEVVVHTETNDTVTDIPDGSQQTVTNDASTTVSKGDDTSDPVTDDASIVLAQRNPDVTIEKSFSDNTLVSGQSTTANITATVGEQNVQSLTITEPTAGTPTFTEQGLSFDGFADGVEWPVAATSAEITYTYSDCPDSTSSTTTQNTLPAAEDGCTVEAFTVVFSAEGDDIVSGAYAALPLNVTALPTEEAVSSTNAVDTEVENANGQTGTDDASAPFTIDPLTLDTSVTKAITPDTIWGVPGTDADMTLTGNVTPESTAGSEKLVISDPADPTADSEFWDNFTATEIDNTDIPECTTLTVRYWPKSTDGPWTDLPGATEVPGPEQLWSYQIPADLQDDIGGIQFEYLPSDAPGCPALLPPGFTVVTHVGISVTQPQDDEVTYDNVAQSLVDNPDAGGEKTDTADDDIHLLPIDGDGPGPDFLDKEWTPDDDVPALSGDTRTARLLWSTDGLNITEMTLSDISATEDPQTTAETVYDAFDLVRIDPITPQSDPLIVNDVITEVSLYLDGQGWTDITSQACANGCDGQFGGYTLSDGQSADALAMRIVLTEKTPGAGVGSSYERRPFDLDFRVRDTLRSDPSQFVLGDLHPYGYNTGEPGLVDNTASAQGVNESTGIDSTDVADDTILIVDEPINAEMTKTFDQDQLGLPDPALDVDPADYPLISATITATNTSAARVSGMVIDEPTAGQPLPDTVFDTLDLYDIDAIQLPSGITEDETTVTLSRSGTDTDYTYAEALALEPDDLADVTGVSIAFRSDDGSAVIPTNGTGGVTLTWQLRETLRSDPSTPVTTTPAGDSIVNNTDAQLESPVLEDCADNQCGTGAASASDEFAIVNASYAIQTTKSIDPSSVYEDESKDYTTQLGGRPNGTARTTLFTLTDTTPTFWNTMDYTGAQIAVPAPVNQVAMDVLGAGVTYVEGPGGELVALCDGLPLSDTSDCWVQGDWVDGSPGDTVVFDLPSAVTDPTTVVGVRFRAQQVDGDGNVLQWERPYNPQLTFAVSTERRDTLRNDPDTLVSTTRPDLQPNPGETDLGVISDDVQSYSEAQFGDQKFDETGYDDATTTVLHRPNAVKVTKTRGSSALVSQSGTIPYVITVTNDGEWNMTGFHVVDQVQTDAEGSLLVEPDPPAYAFALSGTGAPSGDPDFTASLNEQTGELSIDGPDDFVFNAGWTLTVNAPLKFRDDVTPDMIVTNEVTVTSDRLFETCEGTTVVNGRDLTPKPVEDTPPGVEDCSADTSISPLASATIAAKKYVKGSSAGDPNVPGDDDLGVLNVNGDAAACDASQDGVTDDGFYSFPCSPVTRPGGTETWRVDFTNTGNTSARVVAAVDTLPQIGDQGVIVSGDRGSQFPVTLTGRMSGNFEDLTAGDDAVYGIYLSPVQLSQACNTNAIKVWTENAAEDPSCDFGWVRADASTPPAMIQSARSVMMVLDFLNPDEESPAPGLEPGETLRVTYDTTTPYVLPANSAVPDGLPVAWNSFATASRSNATVTQPERASLVVEPQKVGVAAATGQLELAKTVDAPDYAVDIDLPDSYPMLVSCTSGGQETTLLHADGSDASRPSVAADGTVLIYDSATGPVNLPLFSTCTVVEDPVNPGVTVTVDPEDGVIAERDFAQDTRVWDPYTGETQEASFEITNEYAAGGFTVAKSVDAGGAEDQDGDPIAYDRTYAFEASCIYLDQETIPESDRTFTLDDGDSKEISNIPAGADCTVTETDAGGAASTNVVITEDGADSAPEASSEASFTVLPYEDGSTTALTAVGFENVYTVGAVEVTKIIAGSGGDAWGGSTFTVGMTCTLEGATPNPVFEDTATLSRDDPTWTVTNLPTGAICVVTETENGGANSSTGSVTVTVGDDPAAPVEADITNTFTVGSLQVQKQLEGAPANALDPATTFEYEVSLACTRDVNGEAVDVTIPGGATRTIAGAGTALYEGLPTGAECTVTETEAGHATGHTISPEQPVVIGEGQTPVVVTVTNEFDNGAVSIAKSVDAPDGFPVPESFTATVSCTWQGAAVPLADDGAVTIVPGAAPVVIEDVPVGSVCSVDEDDAGQTGTTVSPEEITVTEADQTFAMDVENTYEWASLEVGKVVESTSPYVPTQFGFHVVCTFEGETVVDKAFTLDAGETETITEIPARSECTVTETDDREADGTVTEAEVPGAEGDLAPQIDQETRTVVIPELQPDSTATVNTVTYTNLFDSTALVLVKDFEGAGADQFGLDQEFTFSVTCTYAGETVLDEQVVLNAANGWSSPVHDAVAGSVCSVVEDDLNGADAVVITPNDGENTSIGTGVVPEGGGLVTVTATNWYLTGSVQVTKAFAGDGAEKYGTSAYELRLRCVRDGEVVDVPEGAVRMVSADSPTALWENLPTGSDCRLTEVDDGGANSTQILDENGDVVAGDGEGYDFTVETDPTILSVDDQPQPSLTVENTFNLAQVSVTKAVDDGGAVDANGDPVGYGPFQVTLACMWDEQRVTAAEPMTQQIQDGETVTWTELPEEADCTVTESDTAGAESTTMVVTQGGADGEPQAVTTTELAPLPNTAAADQTSVAITNTFGVSALSISKIVDGSGASAVTRTFPVDVTCVLIDPSHPAPGLIVRDETHQVGGPSRQTAEIADLPAGSECTITETDAGDADRTTMTVDGETQNGPSGTVTLASGHVSIAFTNTFIAPLPATGADTRTVAIAVTGGLALLLIGAMLIATARRRRRLS
ncbi:DUF5979 domain-containing protein [Microbacterium sp. KUDC0406]|uniref:DUF5979 domain-containing protein n=1 Tax=Microbacterium sp. KUDC0406 TaxID=2909588 RepID=UPI001F25814A|nr:DUF5979 domain-containing protein [Microbacterium sp. KUDC0406]UJP11221.1 DUF5979 domain-containing protein [Microbacterium sp. KUDC0406]